MQLSKQPIRWQHVSTWLYALCCCHTELLGAPNKVYGECVHLQESIFVATQNIVHILANQLKFLFY